MPFEPRSETRSSLFAFSYAVGLMLLHISPASAGIISSDRLGDWRPGITVGVPGGIPNNTVIYKNLVAAGADSNGVVDCSVILQNALQSCPPGQVVYMPAGTYLVAQTVNYGPKASGVVLRGAGPDKTIIMGQPPSGQKVIGFGGDETATPPVPVVKGTTAGSTNMTVVSVANLAVGTLAIVSEKNDGENTIPSRFVVDIDGTDFQRRFSIYITAISGTNITFWPPLPRTLTNSCQIAGFPILCSKFCGIEDLTLNLTNSGTGDGIFMDQVYGCWIKNVHSVLAPNYHFYLFRAVQCEVRHCFMDRLNHTGSNGAGLLVEAASGCLFEDNIIYRAFPHIEVNFGSSGNVFGYNYMEDSTVGGIVGCSIDSNHGPHNSFNLYEGNISPMFQADGYFGSVSDDTLFRNLFTGTCTGVMARTTLVLNRFTRNYNIVGNVLGAPGITWGLLGSPRPDMDAVPASIYSFGYPYIGANGYTGIAPPWTNWGNWTIGANGWAELDTNVLSTAFLRGNYNYHDKAIPTAEALGTNQLPSSLYLTSKPNWFGDRPWPPVDPANPTVAVATNLPAGFRFIFRTDLTALQRPNAPSGFHLVTNSVTGGSGP